MLSFLKKIFGTKSVEVNPAPYKVETPTAIVVEGAGLVDVISVPKKTAKKPAVKKATTRKPRAPKA